MPFPFERSAADLVSELHLAPTPAAAPKARQYLRDQLHQWQLTECSEDVELAASELVTNSLQATLGAAHSSDATLTQISLRLRLTCVALHVEVWDRAVSLPEVRSPGDLDEGGRGLCLVAAVMDEWGCYRTSDGGKVTWCAIKVPEPPGELLWRDESHPTNMLAPTDPSLFWLTLSPPPSSIVSGLQTLGRRAALAFRHSARWRHELGTR